MASETPHSFEVRGSGSAVDPVSAKYNRHVSVNCNRLIRLGIRTSRVLRLLATMSKAKQESRMLHTACN